MYTYSVDSVKNVMKTIPSATKTENGFYAFVQLIKNKQAESSDNRN